VAPVVALRDGGLECFDCGESAAEIDSGGADVLHADGGAHVLAREIGIEDFGDFVPGRLVRAGDVVEIVAFDEEVVEEAVEVGVHGEGSKGPKFQRAKEEGDAELGRGKGAERRRVSRWRAVEVTRF